MHVPYLLRLSPRQRPLRGDLIAGLAPPRSAEDGCEGPFNCGIAFANHLADRALAGLNRVMEQGVEPLARLIWAPSGSKTPPRDPSLQPSSPSDRTPPSAGDRAPLREPPITADPLVLQDPVIRLSPDTDAARPPEPADQPTPRPFEPVIPLPPDLPPPLLLEPSAEPRGARSWAGTAAAAAAASDASPTSIADGDPGDPWASIVPSQSSLR